MLGLDKTASVNIATLKINRDKPITVALLQFVRLTFCVLVI
jgi:hypothetical protein